MTSSDLPTLLGMRLRLRAVQDSDGNFVQDLYAREEVTRFIGTSTWIETTKEQALARLEGYRASSGRATGIWLIERIEDGRRLGFALLKPIPPSTGLATPTSSASAGETHELEIGWHLHPDSWGQGFATEAGRTLLDHAREHRLGHLVAVTHAENFASQRVAARLGMIHRGTTDRYYDTTCELFTIEL